MFVLKNPHLYKEKNFNIGKLEGISRKQIDEHLLLYSGYVNHVNLVQNEIKNLVNLDVEDSYAVAELRRRFSFEFNGMRLHEYYFEQLEGSKTSLDMDSKLGKFIKEECSDLGGFMSKIKEVSATRGTGWVVFHYEPETNHPFVAWVDSHHIGHLVGLPVLFVLDMWEHAYMVDYTPSEKKKYIDTFLNNMNWKVIEKRFENLSK